MIWLNLSFLYVASVWFFRHDTRQWRNQYVSSAGRRIGYWLLNLVAPLVIPQLVGFRILRKLDKPFGNFVQDNIEEYRVAKIKHANNYSQENQCDMDGSMVCAGSYSLGLIPYATVIVGTILGTPYLEAHAPAMMKWVGEMMMQIGR